MTRILMRFTCVIIAGVLVTTTGAAGLFDWLKLPEGFGSMVKEQQDPQALKIDSYKALQARLYQLNTKQAIKSLNAELDDRNINAIKVHVSKLPGYCKGCGKDFYIVRDLGAVDEHSDPDLVVDLTYSQLNRMIPYFEDEKMDFLDWWQILAIYKLG